MGTVLVFGLWIIALWMDPQYFWQDDAQSELLPMYHDISRALLSGEWPLLSSSTWNGGALAGEHRYGIFSVFQMMLYGAIMPLSVSYALKSALLVLVYQLVIVPGSIQLGMPAGSHGLLTFVYRPTYLFHGMALMLMSLIVSVVLLFKPRAELK